MVTSITDIRRDKNNIYFTFHTNANMRSLCRLITSNGVSVRTVLFNAERKQYGQFSNVSPKKEYRLQCDIGNDVSMNGGVFVASSTPVVIPRDRQNSLWSMMELVLVVLIVIVGLVGLLILFNYPEFFDVFFTPRDEPEKQSLLKKGKKGKKGLLSDWTCNMCNASNPSNASVCEECHYPRGSSYRQYDSDDDTVEIDMGSEEHRGRHSSTKKRHHAHTVKQRARGDRRKEIKRAPAVVVAERCDA